jgi:hypothetical protein
MECCAGNMLAIVLRQVELSTFGSATEPVRCDLHIRLVHLADCRAGVIMKAVAALRSNRLASEADLSAFAPTICPWGAEPKRKPAKRPVGAIAAQNCLMGFHPSTIKGTRGG